MSTPNENWGLDTSTLLNITARLLSLTVNKPGSPNCLSFYYHHASSDDELKVIIKNSTNSKVTVWSQKQQLAARWKLGQVNLLFNDSYQIIFEATQDSYYSGDIALVRLITYYTMVPLNNKYSN